ncbi:MAG: major facilitator superfamily 1 [Frankiales bacterium]|nr:major facilitator superfamily 1 [Frankiales bacterium]
MAATAFALSVAMLGTTLPTPLYDLYRVRFGLSELTITVIFATYAVGVIASLFLFGRLSDQLGRRPVMLAGLALSALSAVTFLLAAGLPLLIVGRVLSGLSAGIFTGTATATLVDLAPPEGRGRATFLAALANMGGLGFGPLLAGVLSQWAGSPLRVTFWVDLALLVPAAIGIWAMPEPVLARSRPRLRPHALRIPAQMRAIFIRAALAGMAGFAVLGLFAAVAPAFLAAGLGVTNRAAIGLVVFAVFASSTAGQAALGRVREAAALPAGCLALIVGMGVLMLGLAVSSLALLILGGVIAGFGQGLSFRAALTMVNANAPAEARGEVASSFFVTMYVAISLPVIGEGVLAEAIGLRLAGITFAAIVAALAAAVLVLTGRQPVQHQPGAPAGSPKLRLVLNQVHEHVVHNSSRSPSSSR